MSRLGAPSVLSARRCSGAALLLSCLVAVAGCESGKVPGPASKPASIKPAAAGSGGAAGTVDKAAADRAAVLKAAVEKAQLRQPSFGKVQAKPVAEVQP